MRTVRKRAIFGLALCATLGACAIDRSALAGGDDAPTADILRDRSPTPSSGDLPATEASAPSEAAPAATRDGDTSDAPPGDVARETPAPADRQPVVAISHLSFPVTVRTTGEATIHALVFTNPRIAHGETLLAVHGLTGTATNFDQLAPAIFADATLGGKIRQLVAIDMVGHGQSSYLRNLPSGTFGQLKIEDNVGVLLQAIRTLRSQGLAPSTIMGHSLGGLEVLAAQQTLLGQGSSLAALGITKAILLAPVPPHGQPWQKPATRDVAPYLVEDEALGTYLDLPPGVGSTFKDRAGNVAPNAPSVARAIERGYLGPEPSVTLAQLTEEPITLALGPSLYARRPTVGRGAFAPVRGTSLAVVSLSEDALVPADSLGALYVYLTGDASRARYLPIVAVDAVHGMHMSNAVALVNASRRVF